jgi:hypothetical protein
MMTGSEKVYYSGCDLVGDVCVLAALAFFLEVGDCTVKEAVVKVVMRHDEGLSINGGCLRWGLWRVHG